MHTTELLMRDCVCIPLGMPGMWHVDVGAPGTMGPPPKRAAPSGRMPKSPVKGAASSNTQSKQWWVRFAISRTAATHGQY